MEQTNLGRTGLRAGRMGLGCGGHSRLGLSTGGDEANAVRIVRDAIELGVNLIDTAESYGTEGVVGQALAGLDRSKIVLSTKAGVDFNGVKCTGGQLRERVEASLIRLQTDMIDIFNLHAVTPQEYPYACEELVPALLDLKAQGKIRHLGITERYVTDTNHVMLSMAVEDDLWEVMMVGFSLLNPSARNSIFPTTQEKGIGTLGMFAVRRTLSQSEALGELMEKLTADGLIQPDAYDPEKPLGFLEADGVADSIPEAAYRFCRWEPGLDVTLSGTGNPEHLRDNAKSLSLPALPNAVLERLEQMFGSIDSISGN